MITFLVRQQHLRLLVVQARDEEHLREILRETGAVDETISWSRYDGPLMVHLDLPVDLAFGKHSKLRDVDVAAGLPNLVEHVALVGHVRADDPIQRECADALLGALCPNGGSVLTSAYRRAAETSDWGEVSLDAKHLRDALREDLRSDGQIRVDPRRYPPGVERLFLYWCETADHDEDWFIVAPTPAEACRYHVMAEGYADGDAWAEYVALVPADAPDRKTGWPSDALLLACGAVIDRNVTPRVVRFGRRTYAEGMLESVTRSLDDDGFDALGQGRPNGTPSPATS